MNEQEWERGYVKYLSGAQCPASPDQRLGWEAARAEAMKSLDIVVRED